MSAKQKDSKENTSHNKKGDPETLNTTDPQEHMEGPLSSFIQKAGEFFPDKTSAKEQQKKEENQ